MKATQEMYDTYTIGHHRGIALCEIMQRISGNKELLLERAYASIRSNLTRSYQRLNLRCVGIGCLNERTNRTPVKILVPSTPCPSVFYLLTSSLASNASFT